MQYDKQHALTLNRGQKPHNKQIHRDLVRKSGAGFDILVDDVVIIMPHAIFFIVLNHAVFGHQSRALVQGTISVSIVPPSVTAKKPEISDSVFAETTASAFDMRHEASQQILKFLES